MASGKTFFSYSRTDSEFVLKLAKDLRVEGANIWLDQLDIPAGSRWDAEIEQALENAQVQLVILSPTSVGSNNVMDEVSYSLEKGKQVIPILLKDCQIPFRLKRLQYINFTSSYDTGFKELLKALNLEKIVGKESDSKILEKSETEKQGEKLTSIQEAQKQKLESEAEQKRKEQIKQDTITRSPSDKSTSAYDSGMKKSPLKLIVAVAAVVIVVFLAIIIITNMGSDENATSQKQDSVLVNTEPIENNSNKANITDNYATLNDDYQPAMVVYTHTEETGEPIVVPQNIFNMASDEITVFVQAEIRAPNSEEKVAFVWREIKENGQVVGEKRKPVNNEYLDVTTLSGMIEDSQFFNEAGNYVVILYNSAGEEIGRQSFELIYEE